MKNKKNRFWLFVFSLCPGAGHMYMGFMKMGLSFLLGFMLLIAVIAITGLDVLAVFPITLYIYCFFHANNIGGLDDERFAALEDEYLLGFGDMNRIHFKLDQKNRNLAAVALIILGIYMLWNVGFGMLRDYMGWDNPFIRAVYYTMRDEVPRIVIAIAIIWFGVSLLRGKKADPAERGAGREQETPVRRIGQNGEAGQTEQMSRSGQTDQAEQMNQSGQMEQAEWINQSGQMEQAEQVNQTEQKEG